MKILCIGDAHIQPNEDLTRFDALGNFLLEEKPDIIVNLGDFLTLTSLSHWDFKKRIVMEGKRYKKDIAAGKTALRKTFSKILRHNQIKSIKKQKQYKPNVVWIDGNHEFWVDKYIQENPQMEGHIDLKKDLELEKINLPFHFIPYKEFTIINGIAFTHVPIAANGQPVSGKYAVRRSAEIFALPVVFGHLHRFENVSVGQHGRETNSYLSCGCFFEHDPNYVHGAANSFWKGVVMLDSYKKGKFDIISYNLNKLMENYL